MVSNGPDKEADIGVGFKSALEQHEKRVFNLVYRLVGDGQKAAEITRQVFVQLHLGRRWIEGGTRTPLWLYGVATTLALDHLRSQEEIEARLARLGQQTRGGCWPALGWPGQRRGRSLPPPELVHRTYEGIRALGESVRVAVVLRDVLGLEYKEIASLLEREVGEIRDDVREGRAAIRSLLGQGSGEGLPR